MFRRVLSTAIAPALIAAAGLAAFFWLRSQSVPPQRTVTPPRTPIVETIAFAPQPSSFDIRVGGDVVPSREAKISAQIAGVVVEKSARFKGGRFVTRDAPLLRIDQANYKLNVASIASELDQVGADLRRVERESLGLAELLRLAEAKRELAANELARVKELVAKKAAPEAKLEEAQLLSLKVSDALQVLKNSRDLLPVQRERLQAQRALADIRQKQAQLDLDRTSVLAPFDGIVTEDVVEVGEFVQAGDHLASIEATDAVEVECQLRSEDLFWLWSGRQKEAHGTTASTADRSTFFEAPQTPATVTYAVGGRTFTWRGVLTRYRGQGIDPTTRTAPCRVIVTDVERKDASDGPPSLMRGMYVTVALKVEPREELWLIPNHALQPNGQIWTVEHGVLRMHTIAPVRVLPDAVLVRAADTELNENDRVVTSQLATAFDGMPVRVRDAASPE